MWFYLYEVSRIGKSTQKESKWMTHGGGAGGQGK